VVRIGKSAKGREVEQDKGMGQPAGKGGGMGEKTRMSSLSPKTYEKRRYDDPGGRVEKAKDRCSTGPRGGNRRGRKLKGKKRVGLYLVF